MKACKGAYMLVFLGMLIILSSFVVGRGIVDVCKSTCSVYSLDKISANGSFSLRDIDILKKSLRNDNLMYSSNIQQMAAFKQKRCRTDVFGVNYLYPKYHQLDMIRGSFFSQRDEAEANRVAVIDREIAWELFGSFDALGMEIKLLDKSFKVIGVFAEGDSIVHRISDNGTPDVYIPIQVLNELYPNAGITYMEAVTEDTTTVGENEDRLVEAIAATGKNPYDYKIIDYNIKRELMEQKPSIIIFMMGIVIILAFARYGLLNIRDGVLIFRRGLKVDYFVNILKKSWLELLKLLLGLLLSLLAIFFIWQLIRFDMFIPKRHIPEELIDLGHYINLVKEDIRGSIDSLGYIPSPLELLIDRGNLILAWSMYFGIIAGFLLFYSGIAQLRLGFKGTFEEALTNAGILVLLSLVFVRIIFPAAGLPFMLKLADGFVWCGFIFTNVIVAEQIRLGRMN